MEGCVVANEVLDSFPVHVLEVARGGGPREVYVDLEGDRFVEVLGPLSEDALADPSGRGAACLDAGNRFQVCLQLEEWFAPGLAGTAARFPVRLRLRRSRTLSVVASTPRVLQTTGRFCQDSSKGRMLHGGHRSFREMATASGHALHVTAARGDYLWMHLDRVSPSSAPTGDGRCRYRTRQALAHIRRDVIPLLLRLQASPPKETVPGR